MYIYKSCIDSVLEEIAGAGELCISQQELAKQAGCSVRSLQRAIEILVARGAILVQRGNGRGIKSVYRINRDAQAHSQGVKMLLKTYATVASLWDIDHNLEASTKRHPVDGKTLDVIREVHSWLIAELSR